MPSDLIDTDAAVIGRDDESQDRDTAVIGRDDLDFPKTTTDYDGETSNPYKPDTGKGRVGGVDFDLGAVIKGTADAVTKTATTVADIAKTAKSDEQKVEPGDTKPTQPEPKRTDKPASNTSSGGGAGYAVVIGFLGLGALGAAISWRSSSKRRRAL